MERSSHRAGVVEEALTDRAAPANRGRRDRVCGAPPHPSRGTDEASIRGADHGYRY